ncbi:hypothetical protein HG531_002985 [Fusarium graminearum]|nr:hypothetical protein HG531_002985 [Fusarium graminearum]
MGVPAFQARDESLHVDIGRHTGALVGYLAIDPQFKGYSLIVAGQWLSSIFQSSSSYHGDQPRKVVHLLDIDPLCRWHMRFDIFAPLALARLLDLILDEANYFVVKLFVSSCPHAVRMAELLTAVVEIIYNTLLA